MDFTDRELVQIKTARTKLRIASYLQMLVTFGALFGIAFLYLGAIDARIFAYGLFAAVAVAANFPQIGGGGPRYEDLVAILESKAKASAV